MQRLLTEALTQMRESISQAVAEAVGRHMEAARSQSPSLRYGAPSTPRRYTPAAPVGERVEDGIVDSLNNEDSLNSSQERAEEGNPSVQPTQTLPLFTANQPGSRSPHRLDNGKWEVGSDIQSQLIKSVGQMVSKLKKGVSYTTFKAWVSALHDWLASHAQLTPE